MPVGLMKASMTSHEFYKWLLFLNNRPPDVQEIQLATIGLMIAKGLGNKNAKMSDFIVSKPAKRKSNHIGMSDEAVSAVFSGFAKKMK